MKIKALTTGVKTAPNAAGTALFLALLAVPLIHAQLVTEFAGNKNAIQFYYGGPGISFPALSVASGNAATGASQTITLVSGATVSSSGAALNPVTTNTPITVGIGSNAETVTPTAVSNCNLTSSITAGPGTPQCTITGTFNNIHGPQEPVTSGTYGFQEAVNRANSQGGGTVIVDATWGKSGGTNTIIGAAAGFSNVYVLDNRGLAQAYWTLQPSTLTSLAVPATQTTSTVTFAGTGTWNGTYYVCVSYIDALGGEGPCSLTSAGLASGTNTIMSITAPAASTGAIGWRAYAGTTYNGAYLLPITSAVCTLTTLESVMPACAIGAAAVFPTLLVSTTSLRPNAQSPTVNLNLTMPQGHTALAYQPSGGVPQYFQTNYGPFPAFGSLTSGQVALLGSVNLPAGFLNTIGRTVRVTGKIALTTLNTATLPYITISTAWAGGLTAGAPVAICSLVPAAAGATATANETFSCTLTTNAIGATAVGSIMTNGWELLSAAAGGALTGATVDTGTAAIGSLGLFSQDTMSVIYTSTTNATGGEQLLDLHIEVLQ